MALILNGFGLDFFGFSGPTPSNAPRNDVALLKTITYRAIKTTGTLIVIISLPFLLFKISSPGGVEKHDRRCRAICGFLKQSCMWHSIFCTYKEFQS
jgi:hypothetical protein